MASIAIGTQPPIPESVRERWEHTKLRLRILLWRFDSDLERWMSAHWGDERRDVMGPPDMSANFMEHGTRQVSTLYVDTPFAGHPDGGVEELIGVDVIVDSPTGPRTIRRHGWVEKGLLWSIMPRVQQFTAALNECLVHVDMTDEGLVYRPVTPDCVIAMCRPEAPSRLAAVAELRERKDPTDKKMKWTWTTWDISEREAPRFTVHWALTDGELGDDVTDLFFPELAGEYRWVRKDGTPFLPWVLYHKDAGAHLFDPYAYAGLVDITLTLCCLWSWWVHCVYNTVNPLKYVIDGEITATTVKTGSGSKNRAGIDPATVVLRIIPSGNGAQCVAGQFSPDTDIKALGESIGSYEARGCQQLGIDPGSIVKESGDARSGYALAISAEAKQESRRRYAPVFQPTDQELIAISAALVNLYKDTDFPEDGYFVEYGLPEASPVAVGAKDTTRAVSLDEPATKSFTPATSSEEANQPAT